RLLALHRQGLLRSSFHSHESPQKNVEHDYAGKSSISRGRTYTGWIRSLAGCTTFRAHATGIARKVVPTGEALAVSWRRWPHKSTDSKQAENEHPQWHAKLRGRAREAQDRRIDSNISQMPDAPTVRAREPRS